METKETKKKRNPIFIIILAILVIGGSWFGISKYQHSLHHEDTDDAQVSGDISPVIPRVPGYVITVNIHDNQHVRKGDTLLILDDRDYVIKVEQAQAALLIAQSTLNSAKATTTAARANIATSEASIGTIDAQIDAAKVTLWRASQDYDRYANLIKDHSITQQQFEQASAAKKQAQQQTNAVSVQSNATASQVGVADATIHQRQVDIDAAKLNLSYTVITAPQDGLVSKVNMQTGQYVQAGQPLFSIVHSENVWVIANFKETQLDKMKEGQKVIVKVDAYPGHQFEAKLSSFSPATGSTFALLPPDNASGNFVKVVQRLPVKIEFSDVSDTLVRKLRPGMNVFVDVHLD